MHKHIDSERENLIKWELRHAPLLVRFTCGKGSLVAVGVIVELSEDNVILSLDNGRFEISLADVEFEVGNPTIIPSPHLWSPVIDHLIISFPGGSCDLSDAKRPRRVARRNLRSQPIARWRVLHNLVLNSPRLLQAIEIDAWNFFLSK
jgi:hypothetical protein